MRYMAKAVKLRARTARAPFGQVVEGLLVYEDEFWYAVMDQSSKTGIMILKIDYEKIDTQI